MKLDWLKGCATALVTPFKKDGSIDEDCFKMLVERQIKNGVKLLVPCGTTGESVTMDKDECLRVIKMTVEVAKNFKGAKVIAGTGSNNTAATIDFTRKARQAGADMALIVGPYYNKPTQEGYFAHFKEIANSVKNFPIMLYNVPGRTASISRLKHKFASPKTVRTLSPPKKRPAIFRKLWKSSERARKILKYFRAMI